MNTTIITPPSATAALAFAHGAGAGMNHAFMQTMAERLADRAIATLRYEFPYMAAGRRRPDHHTTLMAAVREAIDEAAETFPGLPLYAGGKSMGGRMTSMAMAEQPDPRVNGLVFFGFPLHPAGRPSTGRADHLADVAAPMLFLQGTRDKLAPLDLLRPVCDALARATLHIIDGADHGFHVLKRSGRTDEAVLEELADAAAAYMGA